MAVFMSTIHIHSRLHLLLTQHHLDQKPCFFPVRILEFLSTNHGAVVAWIIPKFIILFHWPPRLFLLQQHDVLKSGMVFPTVGLFLFKIGLAGCVKFQYEFWHYMFYFRKVLLVA